MLDMPPLITFHPYQRAWLDDDSRFKIGMFSRQTGKTFTTCAEIVRDCLQAEIEGRRVRWVILSRGERQAKEAVDEAIKPFCKAFYLVYNALLAGKRPPDFSEETFRGESGAEYTALEVRFPSGSRITALPANPDTARGFSANVFLDEFAFHEKSRDIWRAIFPVISKSGLRLRVTSTPNGKDNKFYELWTAKDDIWSRHQVDIHEAVAQGLDRDIASLRRGLADEEAWDQEYELQFLETASSWLSYDLIISCEHAEAGNPDLYGGGPVFVGNDIARRKDLWVAWVYELVGDVLWTREIVELRNASFAAQDAEMDRIFERYRVSRFIMDQTGMGEKPVEDAQIRYGADRVEGVLMSGARPLTVATAAKQGFEDRRVRNPAGNTVLRDDLHKIRKVVGPTGSPRLLADRDGQGHADRSWACFLAIAGALSGVMEYDYIPAGRAETGPGHDDDDDTGDGRAQFGRGAW
jgi:phage FluMu gp28-like protein